MLGPDDVSVRITHCGVCYADVVWTRNKLGNSIYPVVPGYVFDHIIGNFRDIIQYLSVCVIIDSLRAWNSENKNIRSVLLAIYLISCARI